MALCLSACAELPKEVEPANISAQFENGVLLVRVPKAQKAQPVRIPVGSKSRAKELKQ